jgi:exopolysaccharide biosynthesis protein
VKPTRSFFFKLILILILFSAISLAGWYGYGQFQTINQQKTDLNLKLQTSLNDLDQLKARDEFQINQSLEATISAIQATFTQTTKTYEDILDLKDQGDKTEDLDKLLVLILSYLTDKNYASASAELDSLNQQITDLKKSTSQPATPSQVNLPQSNEAPGSGYARQVVKTDIGNFTVSIVSADLNSTKVIVDTASDSSCSSNCPVLSLQDYVSRNGAFAGINGSYFCPASYPSCVGKENSFDTLLMNKNKVYFNSDNNVYSTVPAVIFTGNSARFVGQSLEWGRDTGVDAVIANHPLLLSGGNIVFGGDSDPKKGSKAGRSFVGSKGSTVYIGVVHSATVAEAAHVLKALGLENALNLDSGGSTTLWSGGYKVGPGRNLPNALLFVNK